MEWIMKAIEMMYVFGQIGALGFLAYGAWLASRCGRGFTGEGGGRFEFRHRRRVRALPRIPAEELPFA
jgi:hypothetical protein